MLTKRGFTTTKMFDKKASGKNMRAAIAAVIGQAGAGDLVVIQYSEHGSYVPDDNGDEPDGNDGCLCPYDINANGPITDDELFDMYSAKKTGVKLLVISDSCHSGSNARFAPITTPPTIKGRNAPQRISALLTARGVPVEAGIGEIGFQPRHPPLQSAGRHAGLLMAGCQDTEYSYDASFQGRPMARLASSHCAS